MILTQHGINSLENSEDTSIVTISGSDYEYRKIGNRFWILKNFSYNPWTIQDGNAFYKWEDVSSSLIDSTARADGWRLPNGNDFTDLLSIPNFYDKIKFSKTGRYDSNPASYAPDYEGTYYYSSNGAEATTTLKPGFNVNNTTKLGELTRIHHDFGFSLRLVKNAI